MAIRKAIFVDANGDHEETTGVYETSDYINTSTGVADAAKPVILGTEGLIDGSMIDLDSLGFIEAFVPFSQIENSGYIGKKGQWSWNQKESTILFCLASDTWVNLTTLENIKMDNFFKIASLIDDFVPTSLVASSNSVGKKGQWSMESAQILNKGYLKLCIATDTWVRFEVETLF